MRLTNWQVITGAPCSGKTAVIEELARRGYPVVPETARAIIDAQLKAGRRLEDIRADAHQFENRVFEAKLELESRLPDGQLTFLDRALPDSIAYFELEGLDPHRPREAGRRFRYGGVFLFERLVFVKDRVRTEDASAAAEIERRLTAVYRELGYAPVRVPLMPVTERADWVLSRIAGQAPHPR
jgi:predicted ATPase